MSYTKIITFIFMAIILAGTILLFLPIASRDGKPSIINAFFTSASSLCVTGFSLYDTFEHWSLFGQTVILCLIQIGGLGFMTIVTLISFMIGRKIRLRERILIGESLNIEGISGVVRLIKLILIGTISFELIGAILLCIRFIPEYGVAGGIYKSVFHSVSSFCNAGIDLFGEKVPFSSLTSYANDWLVSVVTMSLVIIGGLGFFVWSDIYRNGLNIKKYGLHTKIVIFMSTSLILLGFLFIFLFEYNNSATIGGASFGDKILASFFQSVSIRTAGFFLIDIESFRSGTVFLMMVLMFIGASPGSTGGGIKTTTFAVLIWAIISMLKRSEEVNIFNKRVNQKIVLKSFTILSIAGLAIIIAIIAISLLEPNIAFHKIVFEVVAAFSTVGISYDITPILSIASKFILVCMMFFGRVGIITIAFTLSRDSRKANFKYPEDKLMVG